MLILLPPSEAKTPAGNRRRPVDLASLSFPELTSARERVASALIEASRRDDALQILQVGASLEPVVRTNIDLWELPAAPAAQVYSGVLYDALDLASLDGPARSRATRWLLVISALWGAVRITDRIPAYRVSMGNELPGIGPLATFWKQHLRAALDPLGHQGVVVDCRSAAYQKAWSPPVPQRTVHISVTDAATGATVSHMAKHTRGLVARHLLTRSGKAPTSPQRIAEAVAERFDVTLAEPPRASAPWTLTVLH